MTSISLPPPIVGQKNTSEEPKVGTALTTIEQYLNQTVPGTGIGTANIVNAAVTEEKLSAAVQVLLNKAAAGLTLVKQAGSTTGSSGNLYLMETNATTLTLPAATSGRMVGVITKNAIEESKMKATGVKIFGDFLAAAGVETITMAENQHVIVEADGTNWWIISGEPRREQAFATKTITTAEAEAGGATTNPSKVRPAIVNVVAVGKVNTAISGSWKVGASVAGEFSSAAIAGAATKASTTLWVNPNVGWKLTAAAVGVETVSAFTLLL